MKVFIDTNILLDVLCNRPDFVEASGKVWKLCETGIIDGCICTLSILNIAYILRKQLQPDTVKQIIDRLDLIFEFVPLMPSDIREAALLGFSDYEDAVQAACADRIRARYIVTRNIKDYMNSSISALKPEELLERII